MSPPGPTPEQDMRDLYSQMEFFLQRNGNQMTVPETTATETDTSQVSEITSPQGFTFEMTLKVVGTP